MSTEDGAVQESTDSNASADADWGAALAEQAEQSGNTPEGAVAPGGALAGGNAMAASAHVQPQVFGQLNADGAVSAPGSRAAATAAAGTAALPNDIEMILDIPVNLTVELGRTRIPIKQILQLAQGSVIELDGLAGEPMDVLINGCLIAQGEVVVVNEKFGIRLTDIITPSERMRKLNR